MMGVKTRGEQGQIGVKEGNAEHVRKWTESNPERDALRQRGRGGVNGNQLTEGLIMKTRQGMEKRDAWTVDVDSGKELDKEAARPGKKPEEGTRGSSYLSTITRE